MKNIFNQVYYYFFKYQIYHAFFWVLYVLFLSLFSPLENYKRAVLNTTQIIFIHACIAYFNNYFLLKWFLFKRKYITYFITLILSITFSFFPLYWFYSQMPNLNYNLWSFEFFIDSFLSVSFTIAITTSLKIFKYWYEKEQSHKELERLNTVTELRYLKSQINPHFLFNCLNNLYALTLKKSDIAPDVVLKLSNILRYAIYEGSEEKVSLSKELQYLKDYIELEKIRIGNRAIVELIILGDFEGKLIEPMLFIPFVENSFKHGINQLLDNAWIKINIEINDEDLLTFEIENSKPKVNILKNEHYKGGIGMENVKKRLKILYPKQHDLSMEDKDNTFKVTLKIKLI